MGYSFSMIIFFLLFYSSLNQCPNHSNCFDCSANSGCEWSKKSCQTSRLQTTDDNWFMNFDQCEKDPNSKKIAKMHCQDSKQSIPILVSLLKVDDKYSFKNLFCKWRIFVPKEYKNSSLKITKNDSPQMATDKLAIKYIFKNITEVVMNIDQSLNYSSADLKGVEFMYTSPGGPHDEEPFILKTEGNDSTNNFQLVSIILGVVFGVILAIITGIVIYCYWKSQKKNLAANQLHIQIKSKDEIKTVPDNDFKDQENQVSYIKLKDPIIYNSTFKSIQPHCVVCDQLFQEEMKVIPFECNNVIHVNCAKNYMTKNKCPNCLKDKDTYNGINEMKPLSQPIQNNMAIKTKESNHHFYNSPNNLLIGKNPGCNLCNGESKFVLDDEKITEKYN